MSLFVCDNPGCNTIENTATSGFWWKAKDAPALCSQCDPEFKKWHGRFKREKWDGKTEMYNRPIKQNDKLNAKDKH